MKTTTFLFLLLISFATSIDAQTSWDYPIKPGSQEWKMLQSHDEMLTVCQIPENILKSLSTKELINLNLDNPLFADCFAYSSMIEGTNIFFLQFNGFSEMFSREGIILLIQEEQNTLLEKFHLCSDDYQKGEILAKLSVLDYMLANKKVLEKSTEAEKNIVIRIGLQRILVFNKIREAINTDAAAYLVCSYLNTITDVIKNSPLLSSFHKTGIAGRHRADIIKEIFNVCTNVIN